MDHTNDVREWLEPDGLGGFASGTVSGVRTRRYHALLLTATTPPTGRVVLVNGFDAWVETSAGRFALSSQRYEPGVVHPDGATRIERFGTERWPRWTFRLPDDTQIEQEILARDGASVVAVTWRLVGSPRPTTLRVRPFLSGRDYHSLHRENGAFRFDAARDGNRVAWQPYASLPRVLSLSNGEYTHEPDWYRNFRYEEELARGLDCVEDLGSPGVFHWDLSRNEAIWMLAADGHDAHELPPDAPADVCIGNLRAAETGRRRRFPSRLHRAADAYLVRRGRGRAIVAGYPWFTDWGRDTFIALRGLCIAGGRLDEAREILVHSAGTVSEGMLPNRFPDQGDALEFNAVDASLWFVVAVYDLLSAAEARKERIPAKDVTALQAAVQAVVAGYARGTRYGIRADADGLLAAGTPGLQLTWMDARVGDWVVTPRIGKPVEVNALWLNALWIASRFSAEWKAAFAKGYPTFQARFWNKRDGYLYDVIDVDHQPGTADATFRPNQIFAVGGLPLAIYENHRARLIVDAVEARLSTPLGLRSLAPGEPGYVGHYGGGVAERDGSYHQGTVWPWLSGPFVEAWVRARGSTPEAKSEARERFLAPLLQHLDEAGLGHVSEIADGDPPHRPAGCPFQAWSVGEALRLDQVILATKPDETLDTRTGASASRREATAGC